MSTDNQERWKKKLKELGNDIEILLKEAEAGTGTEEEFEHLCSNTKVAIYKVRELLTPWRIAFGFPAKQHHELAVQELLDLPVVKVLGNHTKTLADVVDSYVSNARTCWGIQKFTTLSGEHHNGHVDVVIISQLLESLDKAGYVIVKKG